MDEGPNSDSTKYCCSLHLWVTDMLGDCSLGIRIEEREVGSCMFRIIFILWYPYPFINCTFLNYVLNICRGEAAFCLKLGISMKSDDETFSNSFSGFLYLPYLGLWSLSFEFIFPFLSC